MYKFDNKQNLKLHTLVINLLHFLSVLLQVFSLTETSATGHDPGSDTSISCSNNCAFKGIRFYGYVKSRSLVEMRQHFGGIYRYLQQDIP